MATRSNNSKAPATSTLESMDKLASSTLKRNPKMELSKADLLKLLSYLEGELQAREIVIATLKAEKVKQLLQQVKQGGYNMNNPLTALQRDAFAACSPGFDELSVRVAYSNQLLALETLMDAQRCAHFQMKEQLLKTEQRQACIVRELEEERCKHAQDTAQGDDVTYLLEKERGRLKQEVEMEKAHNKKLEKEVRKVTAALEQERAKQKQIVLLLLAERKRIITKFLEERQKCVELEQMLQLEKGRMADMVDGLEEESQRSLQMEAELEQQLALFEAERTRLREAIAAESDKSQKLQSANQSMAIEMESLKQKGMIAKSPASQDAEPAQVIKPPLSSTVSHKPGGPPAPPVKPSHPTPPAKSATSVPFVNRNFKTPPSTANDNTSAPPAVGSTKVVQSGVSSALPVSSRPVPGPVHSVALAPSTTKDTDKTGTNDHPIDGQPTKPTITPPAKIPPSTAKPATFPTPQQQLQQLPPPQPPKKPVAAVRGTPPPVPPNKPVLVPVAKRITSETSETGDGRPSKGGAVKVGGAPLKTTNEGVPPSGAGSSADGNQVGMVLPPTTSMDLLGQELADFQQLLVSMVAGKGIEILSAEHLARASSQGSG